MKNLSLVFIAALSLAACSSPTAKTGSTDTVINGDTLAKAASTPKTNNTPTIASLCFLRMEGTKNQDSTTVELTIKGSTVTGEMHWIPAEKDGRKGVLTGTQTGNTINAMWTFKQEGMTDTMAVKFKLDGNEKLLQKPLKLNTKTGRQQTDEAAGYTVEYKPYAGVVKSSN
jgi:hypothetical protein